MRRVSRGLTLVVLGAVTLCIDVVVNVIASGKWSWTVSGTIIIAASAVGVLVELLRPRLGGQARRSSARIFSLAGDDVLERPIDRTKIVNALCGRRTNAVVLYGDGGVGKSTLARSVCEEPAVRRRFHTMYQVQYGEENVGDLAIAGVVNGLIEVITGTRPAHTDPDSAAQHLTRLLEQSGRTLLFIDDVWTDRQVAPLMTGAPQCIRLITTRRSKLPAGSSAVAFEIGAMSDTDSQELLLRGLRATEREALLKTDLPARVAERSGNWPLILGLLNRVLRAWTGEGRTPEASLTAILDHLANRGPSGAEDVHLQVGPQERSALVEGTLMAGLSLLGPDDARERLLELAVFRPYSPVPVSLVAGLWSATSGRSTIEADALCSKMAELSFFAVADGHLRMHDVMYGYLRSKLDQSTRVRLTARVADLLTDDSEGLAYSALDPYLREHLIWHLVEAGREREAESWLCGLRWVLRRVAESGITDLLADLMLVGSDRTLRLARVIERLAHVLRAEDGRDAVQFLLNALRTDADWAAQAEALQAERADSGLVACWPLPDNPSEALKYVHRLPPASLRFGSGPMALSLDGTWLVVLVWHDLHVIATSTRETTAIYRCEYLISGFAISPDGIRLATIGSGLVCVRDVATGAVRGQSPHSGGVLSSIVFTSDGTQLVTTGDDGRVRLWNGDDASPLHQHSREAFPRYTESESWGSCDAVVTSDGTRVVSSGDGVYLWSLPGGRRIAALKADRFGVFFRHVAVAPDSSWVAATRTNYVDVLSVDSGDLVTTLEFEVTCALAVSRDGLRLAGGNSTGSILVWDTRDFSLAARLDGHEGLKSLHFHPDGEHLYSSGGGEIRAWHLPSATAADRHEPSTPAGEVIPFPDTGAVAVALVGGTVQIRNIATAQIESTLVHRGYLAPRLAVAPDGTWLATVQTRTVIVWSRSGDVIKKFDVYSVTGEVKAILVSPDSKRLLTVDDVAVRAWNPRTGARMATMAGMLRDAAAIVYAQDGSWLAVGDFYGAVWVWDIPRRTLRWTLGGGYLHASVQVLAVTADNTLVALEDGKATAHEWDVERGLSVGSAPLPADQPQDPMAPTTTAAGRVATAVTGRLEIERPYRTFAIPPHQRVQALAFSPDGHHLAVAGGSSACILDTESGVWQTLGKGTGSIRTAVLARNGRYLAVAGTHGVQVWDAADGRAVCVLPVDDNPVGLAIDPDSGWIAVACPSSLHVMDLPTGGERTTVPLPLTDGRYIQELVGSPDGAKLVVRVDSGHLIIVDVGAARPHAIVEARDLGIRRMAVSPDSRWLATAGTDLAVHRLVDGVLVARHAVTRPMTSLAWSPDCQTLLAGGAGGSYCFRLQ